MRLVTPHPAAAGLRGRRLRAALRDARRAQSTGGASAPGAQPATDVALAAVAARAAGPRREAAAARSRAATAAASLRIQRFDEAAARLALGGTHHGRPRRAASPRRWRPQALGGTLRLRARCSAAAPPASRAPPPRSPSGSSSRAWPPSTAPASTATRPPAGRSSRATLVGRRAPHAALRHDGRGLLPAAAASSSRSSTAARSPAGMRVGPHRRRPPTRSASPRRCASARSSSRRRRSSR